jgi:hypothetical protein
MCEVPLPLDEGYHEEKVTVTKDSPPCFLKVIKDA